MDRGFPDEESDGFCKRRYVDRSKLVYYGHKKALRMSTEVTCLYSSRKEINTYKVEVWDIQGSYLKTHEVYIYL